MNTTNCQGVAIPWHVEVRAPSVGIIRTGAKGLSQPTGVGLFSRSS
ncbi:hypothetical protein [Lampropedia puyangensis]